MAACKPTLLFVPGAWHTPAYYAGIIEALRRLDYLCVTVELPAVGPSDAALVDANADTRAVRAAIIEQLCFERDVLVIAHSYGGLVSASAVKDQGRSDRLREGHKNGVIGLLFITAFVIKQGMTLAGTLQAAGEPLAAFIEFAGSRTIANDAANVIYSDLPPEEAKKWSEQLKPLATNTFTEQVVTCEPWSCGIPCHYIVATNDKCLATPIQESMLASVQADKTFESIVRLATGHCPWLTQESAVVDVIEKAVSWKQA